MMSRLAPFEQPSIGRRRWRFTGVIVGGAVVVCARSTSSTPSASQDPVAAAGARVVTAQNESHQGPGLADLGPPDFLRRGQGLRHDLGRVRQGVH